MPGYFITGTDTDAGKTLITLGLMLKLQQAGVKVNAMKPVAAGSHLHGKLKVNQDALLLQQQSDGRPEYEYLNPYLFEPAIAPHIAAAQLGVVIDMNVISRAFRRLEQQATITLVEGAGGWMVPLNERLDISDLPAQLNLPVILVVGLKLGCINHARLSMQSIVGKGCRLAGWVGTQVEADMLHAEENVAALKQYLDAPCLGIVPFLSRPSASVAAENLFIEQLLKT